jgi:hypothetical protein
MERPSYSQLSRYDKFRDHHAEVSLDDPVMTAVYTLLRREPAAREPSRLTRRRPEAEVIRLKAPDR